MGRLITVLPETDAYLRLAQNAPEDFSVSEEKTVDVILDFVIENLYWGFYDDTSTTPYRPYLQFTGFVKRIHGDFGEGITQITYDEMHPPRAFLRYDFDRDQHMNLVAKGISDNPEFISQGAIPAIFQENTLEIPWTVTIRTVKPRTVKYSNIPLMFASVPEIKGLTTTKSESGYDLVDYFPAMQPAVSEAERAAQLDDERYKIAEDVPRPEHVLTEPTATPEVPVVEVQRQPDSTRSYFDQAVERIREKQAALDVTRAEREAARAVDVEKVDLAELGLNLDLDMAEPEAPATEATVQEGEPEAAPVENVDFDPAALLEQLMSDNGLSDIDVVEEPAQPVSDESPVIVPDATPEVSSPAPEVAPPTLDLQDLFGIEDNDDYVVDDTAPVPSSVEAVSQTEQVVQVPEAEPIDRAPEPEESVSQRVEADNERREAEREADFSEEATREGAQLTSLYNFAETGEEGYEGLLPEHLRGLEDGMKGSPEEKAVAAAVLAGVALDSTEGKDAKELIQEGFEKFSHEEPGSLSNVFKNERSREETLRALGFATDLLDPEPDEDEDETMSEPDPTNPLSAGTF